MSRSACMLLICVVLLPAGCGVPRPDSEYVAMDDGTQLAVNVWLPPGPARLTPLPTIVRLGRYWREYDLPFWIQPLAGRYLRHIAWLSDAGYAVVLVDVRGTGASFGVSTAPWSPREIADYPQVVDWIVRQPWSNGRVGAYGISYDGVTSDWLSAANHPNVLAVLPTYSYCDVYADVSHPGGLLNDRFLKAWGTITYEMDRNNPDFLYVLGAADPTGFFGQFTDLAAFVLRGVQPVRGAAFALIEAIAEHLANLDIYEATREIEFRDDRFGVVSTDDISPLLTGATRRAAAIRRVVGWQDAGTARGALRAYNSLDAAHHVVVISPESHTGNYRVDPYDFSPPAEDSPLPLVNETWQAVPFFDAFLRGEPPAPQRQVVYYTYGVNTWQQTRTWPPSGLERERWYFGPAGTLTRSAPAAPDETDSYTVDFLATTGTYNRWFSGLGGVPVYYPDRAEQDLRLRVYDTVPLEQALELTGHPVVSLQLASTHADGAIFVYLEEILPDGRVVYLSEGQLRAVHRQVSSEPPPIAVFGPYHTYRRADALPLEPGVVAEITFDLLPISTVIAAGHRLRVALAGHDADTFPRYPAEGTPTWTIHRNAAHASWIDVPVRPWPGAGASSGPATP